MDVLVISHYFWPETFLINDLCLKLNERGINITVLTGMPNYPDGKIFEGYNQLNLQKSYYKNIEIIRVPIFPRGQNSDFRLALNYLSFIVSGSFIGPFFLNKRRFDVIFFYGPSPIFSAIPAIIISKIIGKPLVTWVQDLWPDVIISRQKYLNKFVLKLVSKVVSFIYKSSDLILIQSEYYRESVNDHLKGISKPIIYYPNSCEQLSNEIKPSSRALSFINEISSCFSIIYAGNLGFAQGLETIIEAAALLKDYADIKIFLIGSGSRKKFLCDIINKKKLRNIRIVDQFSQNDIKFILKSASALYIGLKDDRALNSTIPSKLSVYMSVGRPIIGSINGVAAQIIKEANAGLFCDAEDFSALSDIILNIFYMDKVSLDIMGLDSKSYFLSNFEINYRVEYLLGLMRELIKK